MPSRSAASADGPTARFRHRLLYVADVTEPFFENAAVARDRYVAFFRRVIDQSMAVEPTIAVEILVQPNGRASPPPFCLIRVDVLLGGASAPRIQRVADEIGEELPRRHRLSSGLEVHQTGFSWEALRIVFSAEGFQIDFLRAWLQLWLDPGEVRRPDSSGLCGVVHELAWSYLELDRWQLDVDLGSAPLLALEELMDVLAGAGVRTVAVSRHDAGAAGD